MFHICFCANESYIKYTATLITSIVKATNTAHTFADFFTSADFFTNTDFFTPPPI